MKNYYFLLLLLFVACNTSQEKTTLSEASIESKKEESSVPVTLPTVHPKKVLNAGFVAINGVFNSELIAPFDILQHSVFHTELGIKPFVVSPTKDAIKTFEGIQVLPDYSFKDAPEIDILIVPSAEHSMDSDLENEQLIRFIKERGEKAMYVMSLCDGAFVLAQAGLLDERKCTTFPSDIEKFRNKFPQLAVQENVSFVHDGKALTSAGGAKSYDVALYLIELLYGQKSAKGVAGGLVIDWDLNQIQHIR